MSRLQGRVGDLSHDGRGVVRVDGKVYFVEGALPSETITFTRQRRHRHHEIGRLEEILDPSPERVTPPCEYFGVCGGCALQHLSSEGQVAYKQRMLLENLARIAKTAPGRVLDPVTGPAAGYRRKARLGVRHVPKKGGVLVGFRERHKSYITSLDHCLALDTRVSALLPSLHDLVANLECFDRLPQVEVACGDTHVALIFRHLVPLGDGDRTRLARYAGELGVDVLVQGGGPETVAPLAPDPARPLYYDLARHGVRIGFEAGDFVQVNGTVNEMLVDLAVELLDPGAGDSVLELFSGIGNFSLPLARRSAGVVAVEASEAMVTRAGANADANGIGNCNFVAADLYSEAVAKLSQFDGCNKLFLDPPRSGAMEVVRDLVPKLLPERILYVSCNPATLARDAEVLVHRDGYRLAAAGIVDMFPHTAHVESVALFER